MNTFRESGCLLRNGEQELATTRRAVVEFRNPRRHQEALASEAPGRSPTTQRRELAQ